MTGNSYLLNTNIISALFKGEQAIAAKIDEAASVYIPVIAVGELHFGAELVNDSSKYIDDIESLTASYTIFFIDSDTCRKYGAIKAALRKKGRPIPENDIWIAAIAMQHNFIVATRDKHFLEVDGLAIEEW